MTLNQGKSLWVHSIETTAHPFPELPGDMHVDVAVIGGGIVGLTAAEKLLQQGRSVVVIEARRIGRQVTGKSTAKITSQHNLTYHRLTEEHGEEKTRYYAEANQAAIEEIAAITDKYNIACDFERKNAYVYSRDGKQIKKMKEEVATALKLGLPVTWQDRADLPFPIDGVVCFANQAQFNPGKYLVGLALSLEQRGCAIYENTRVEESRHGAPCHLVTGKGTVTARDVVMATHMPLGKTGLLFAKAFPRTHPMIAARIRPEAALDGMYISAEEPIHSFRSYIDGDGNSWLIAVGQSFQTGHSEQELESFKDLEAFLRQHFGIDKFDFKWTNHDYYSMDGVPFIGRASAREKHFYVGTGFNAWGITTSTVAGIIIADLIAGEEGPWTKCFEATRIKPLAGGRRFISENLKAGRQLVQGRLQDRPHHAGDILPGEAVVLEQHDDKIAVFKDEDENIYAVSAVCPHMGCILGWNRTERTWDCPCHGSRFDYDGQLLHGPAVSNLEPMALHEMTREGEPPRAGERFGRHE